MSEIKIGDRIKIAKGVTIYHFGYHADECEETTVAKRDVTATVTSIITDPSNWVTFLNPDEVEQINHVMRGNPNDYRYALGNNWPAIDYTKVRAALTILRPRYTERFGDNPRFLVWGSGSDAKGVLERDAIPVTEAKKAPKEQKITKRRLMVVGSRWKFTRDVEITQQVPSPEFRDLIKKRNNTKTNATRQIVQHEIEKILGTPAEYVTVTVGKITKDTVVRLIAKPRASFYFEGLEIVVVCETGSVEMTTARQNNMGFHIPISQVEPAMEPLEVPEELVYVFRDTETQEFFGGWETAPDRNYITQLRQTDVPKMVKTFSSSKKYKTSSAAKASIRDFTGYNDGLDDEGGAPEWVAIGYAQKKIDLPPTWEMVAIDKTTNTEKQIIDIQNWYRELMRLRELTVRHGSGLRAVYKKAEGKPDLDTIVVLTNIPTRWVGGKSYTERTPFEDDIDGATRLAAISDAQKRAITGKFYTARTPATVAFACGIMDATLFVLAITDPALSVVIYDIETLSELIMDGSLDVSAVS